MQENNRFLIYLPKMQLDLISLGHRRQTVEMAEQLHPVVGLNVMHAVAEHFQKSV